MNSEQFHTAVSEAFKKAVLGSDGRSPLEWDALPSSIVQIMEKVLLDAVEESRDSIFGAPFHIDSGKWSDNFATHIPNTDAVLEMSLNLFSDGDFTDGSIDEVKFNLADAILHDATDRDQGWVISVAIRNLEGTIAKLKREASARGWDLEK